MIDLVDNDPDDATQIGNEKGHQPKVTNTSKIMEHVYVRSKELQIGVWKFKS